MSDTSQGEGWWEASDGKWYAPELHPDYVAPVPEPEPAPAPETPPATEPLIAPIEPPPVGGPPPIPPPPLVLPGEAAASGGDGATGNGKGKLIAAIIVIVLLIGGGIAFAVSRNDDDSSSAKSDQSTSSDTSSSSDSTDSTDTSESTDTSATEALIAKANASLLTVDDLRAAFEEVTPGEPAPLPCTGNRVVDLVDAAGHAQVRLDDAAENISISENIYVYQSVDDATTAYDGIKSGLDCASGNIGSGSDETLLLFDDVHPPSSAGFGASDDDFKVAGTISSSTDPNLHRQTSTTLDASATDQSSASSSEPLAYFEAYVSRVGQSVLTFTFLYTPDSQTTGLDQPETISEKGVNRFAS